MQSLNDIKAILFRIIRANLSNAALDLEPETTPSWDSITMVDIILDSEDAFGIRLSVEDLDHLYRVGDLVDAIHMRLREIHAS